MTFESYQPLLSDQALQKFGLLKTEYLPCKQLSDVVHSYIQIEVTKPVAYPVIPDGAQAVYIGPNEVYLSQANMKLFEFPRLEIGRYFGIRFLPAAMRAFPTLKSESDTSKSLITVDEFNALRDKLYETASIDSNPIADVFDDFLVQRYQTIKPTVLDQALQSIYHENGDVSVAETLVPALGISARQLNRLFNQSTGYSCKQFMAIVRLQTACKTLHNNQLDSLQLDSLVVALQSGFFDQSHFLNAFKSSYLASPIPFFQRFMSDFSNP